MALYKRFQNQNANHKLINELNREDERQLCDWILQVCDLGFLITKHELLDCVEVLAKSLPRADQFESNWPNNRWYRNFQNKYPKIVSKLAASRLQSFKSSSPSPLCQVSIQNWRSKINAYVKSLHSLHVLQNPKRIFSVCEKTIELNTNEMTTKRINVLIGANASGDLLPAKVIFAYPTKHTMKLENAPDDLTIEFSQCGHLNADSFFDYISHSFLPWIERLEITLPIVIFIDAKRSHLSLNLSTFCNSSGIILLPLPPSIESPIDGEIFKFLHSKYQERIIELETENDGKSLSELEFAHVLKEVLLDVKREMFVNAFRYYGLYPFDANTFHHINAKDSFLDEENRNKEKCMHLFGQFSTFEQMIIRYISPFVLGQFEECYRDNVEWYGRKCHLSLFEVWRKFKDECNAIQMNVYVQMKREELSDNDDKQMFRLINKCLD